MWCCFIRIFANFKIYKIGTNDLIYLLMTLHAVYICEHFLHGARIHLDYTGGEEKYTHRIAPQFNPDLTVFSLLVILGAEMMKQIIQHWDHGWVHLPLYGDERKI